MKETIRSKRKSLPEASGEKRAEGRVLENRDSPQESEVTTEEINTAARAYASGGGESVAIEFLKRHKSNPRVVIEFCVALDANIKQGNETPETALKFADLIQAILNQ